MSAPTKTSTALTWASGSATASGTTVAVDVSGSFAGELNVQVVTVGTATTPASFLVQFSGDATTYRSQLGPFQVPSTAASTYRFPPIPYPPGCSSVQLVYTAQAGGTSSTLTGDVTKVAGP